MKKIALVHDYLREYGGAERVLEALHRLCPQAPVYTAFIDRQALGLHAQKFEGWDIRQTWLARIPLIKLLYSPLRLLAPKAFADLDLAGYDLVISSSNAYYAKAVRAPHGKHYCYCHTPPRSLYGYTTMSDWQKNPLVKFFGTLINHYLRVIDFQIAQKVDVFIANSRETQRRIAKFYRRSSVVIFPPVELIGSQSSGKQISAHHQEYYLYVNRLALAKHPELAVQACTQLNLPLKVVGSGPTEAELRQMAGPKVEFLGAVSDDQLYELYAGAKALIYPVEDEDFGMIPVEAMLAGVPVIAHRSGGPIETVVEGKTGLFFSELTVESLITAIQKFAKRKFSTTDIQKHAQQFSRAEFERQIKKLVG